MAPVITATSIILGLNKIQNGDILVLANPGRPGKWPLKWRENFLCHLLSNGHFPDEPGLAGVY